MSIGFSATPRARPASASGSEARAFEDRIRTIHKSSPAILHRALPIFPVHQATSTISEHTQARSMPLPHTQRRRCLPPRFPSNLFRSPPAAFNRFSGQVNAPSTSTSSCRADPLPDVPRDSPSISSAGLPLLSAALFTCGRTSIRFPHIHAPATPRAIPNANPNHDEYRNYIIATFRRIPTSAALLRTYGTVVYIYIHAVVCAVLRIRARLRVLIYYIYTCTGTSRVLLCMRRTRDA